MRRIATTISVLLALAACSPTTYTRGVPNWACVAPHVCHSGQPTTAAAWRAGGDMLCAGRNPCRVHVVKLDRESEGSDDVAQALGFDVLDVSMHPYTDAFPYVTEVFRAPEPDKVREAEALVTSIPEDGDGADVYWIHCVHGWDRTERFVWEYLYRRRGWTWEGARAYAVAHGYHRFYYELSKPWR